MIVVVIRGDAGKLTGIVVRARKIVVLIPFEQRSVDELIQLL
jgi:hypothetical protein